MTAHKKTVKHGEQAEENEAQRLAKQNEAEEKRARREVEEQMKREWRARARRLIERYESNLANSAPRSSQELQQLRELLGVRTEEPMPDRLHEGFERHLHDN